MIQLCFMLLIYDETGIIAAPKIMSNTMADFFASTAKGLENLCLEELQSLGAENCRQRVAGVSFECDWPTVYKIALWTRFASRIMLRLVETEIRDARALYRAAHEINWQRYFTTAESFAVTFNGTNDFISNSQFGALTIKDAIVDHFTRFHDERPNVERQDPDVRIVARLANNFLAISLDIVGQPLHRRGYRTEQGEAPLRENLAAAVVARSKWTEEYMVDPMCGSGTLLIEAALAAYDIAPGLNRPFALTKLKNYDEQAWSDVKDEAQQRAQSGKANASQKLIGYDSDKRMVAIAKANIERAGLSEFISVHTHDAADIAPAPKAKGLILSNPPYGERLGELTKLVGLFLSLGAGIKQHYAGWRVALFSGSPELLDYLRMRADKQYKFFNGALECTLKLYQVGEGEQSQQRLYAEDFVNRLKKNQKKLGKWLKREELGCYRLYDADLPEYNVAVDVYQDHWVVQEYRAPKSIDANKARRRMMDLLTGIVQSGLVDNDKLIIKQRQQQKGKQQYQRNANERERMVVSEYGAQFYVNLTDYLDTGLFLDHRNMRHYIQQNAKGKAVLNLFAYTGSASVHAAIGGAEKVTTVDMSNTYLNWAKDNFRLNKLSVVKHDFVRADCLAWLGKATQTFDLIFLDPPTFSNSKKMEDAFDVQRDHVDLIAQAVARLNNDGQLIFSNNKRQFKMEQAAIDEMGCKVENISKQSLSPDFERNKHIHNCWLITKN